MRDKIHVRDDKMHVISDICDPDFLGEEAKRRGRELIEKEHRGAGDTVEAAAYRLHLKHGVAVEVLLQCWNRPAREMKVSRWMSVFAAHLAEFDAKAKAAYEEKRQGTNVHPVLVKLADYISRRTVHDEAARDQE